MKKEQNIKTKNVFKTLASEKGHTEIVAFLQSEKGIDVNQKNHTALTLASRYGHKEIVDIFLKHKGIDINQHTKIKNINIQL